MWVRLPPGLLKTKAMSIDTNIFKVIPGNLGLGFGFCVYGETSAEVMNLADVCNFKVEKSEKYTNFFPTEKTDFKKMFFEKKFKYMDGFSPNLNKDLHIGHFSNLVLAKAFQKLGVAEEYVSILGDTVCENEIQKEEKFAKFSKLCLDLNYKVNNIFFASEMKYDGKLLKEGEGEYLGTKIVESGEEKIVVIKSDGSTSYFYQDMALAAKLNEETLYLTGYEQDNHFKTLKSIFPHVNHVGLGLVKLQTKDGLTGKMSTRLGNVVYMTDLMDELKKEFNGNEKLCYNIFAGYILKNHPTSDKVFSMDTIKNPKNSPGLYLSYTMARLKSAGCEMSGQKDFFKQELQFAFLKSKASLNPTYLFNALVDLCKEINNLYITHQIVGNEENKKMFGLLLSDLDFGMMKLGMFGVDKV
jgi:arginyl-tRNA synthetase